MSKWIFGWDVESETSRKTYRVSLADDGDMGCSCPHWTNRRKQCKHIRGVISLHREFVSAVRTYLKDARGKDELSERDNQTVRMMLGNALGSYKVDSPEFSFLMSLMNSLPKLTTKQPEMEVISAAKKEAAGQEFLNKLKSKAQWAL